MRPGAGSPRSPSSKRKAHVPSPHLFDGGRVLFAPLPEPVERSDLRIPRSQVVVGSPRNLLGYRITCPNCATIRLW